MGLSCYIFEYVDFPSRKSGSFQFGIRAILDPRMRPLGLDGRNRSGTCLFLLYVLTLHLFMHGLSFSSPLIPFLWTDLQTAPAVELPSDGLSYRGFAQMLYNVLEELGVRSSTSVVVSQDPTDCRATLSSTLGFQ